jgi:hypothetical protein
MTAAVAFKTTQPELIAAYLQAREEITAAWRAKVDAFQVSVGGREVFGTSFFDGGWAVQGFCTPNSFAEIPEGWRREGKFKAVPAKRTPEGLEHAKTLATLRLAGNSYPGCPDILFAEGFSIFPRVQKIGENYFLTLSKVPLNEPGNALDREIWEPVKLSAYHAAIEDAEAGVKA